MTQVLLMLDFINEIVHPDGKSYRGVKEEVIGNAVKVLERARERNIPVVHVKVGFSKDYKEVSDNSPLFSGAKQNGALKLGTWATEFHEKIDVRDEDYIVVKHRVNAWYSTPLALILSTLKADTLILCGVATDMVVQTTAREAHDRDFKVIVIEDACATGDQDIHHNTIKSLERLTKVIKTDEF